MEEVIIDILKLMLAVGIGSIIGIERHRSKKPVGMRTLAMVCAGSALMGMLAVNYFPHDAGRILGGVVTGIGFLGAGAIIAHGTNITGLTTAAVIWAMAIVGLCIGVGAYALSIVFSACTFLLLKIGVIEDEILRHIPRKKLRK